MGTQSSFIRPRLKGTRYMAQTRDCWQSLADFRLFLFVVVFAGVWGSQFFTDTRRKSEEIAGNHFPHLVPLTVCLLSTALFICDKCLTCWQPWLRRIIKMLSSTSLDVLDKQAVDRTSGSFFHPQPPSLLILHFEPGSDRKVLTKQT